MIKGRLGGGEHLLIPFLPSATPAKEAPLLCKAENVLVRTPGWSPAGVISYSNNKVAPWISDKVSQW